MSEWSELSEAKILKIITTTEETISKNEEQLLRLENLRDGALQELAIRDLKSPARTKTIIDSLRMIYSPYSSRLSSREHQERNRSIGSAVSWLRDRIRWRKSNA